MVRCPGQVPVAIEDIGFEGMIEGDGAVLAHHLGVVGAEGGRDRRYLAGAAGQRGMRGSKEAM